MKEFYVGEIAVRRDVRSKLFERYIAATVEERVRIEADLERMDAEIRRLGIGAKALNYAPQKEEPPQPPNVTIKEVSDHWLDRFNDLARHRNEPWRAEMLSRALAVETENPGSIGGRALWLIGTMEESLFQAFSAFLNLCFWPFPEGEPFNPDSDYANDKAIVLVLNGRELVMGQLLFLVEQAGLLGNLLTTSKAIPAGGGLQLIAGNDGFLVKAKVDHVIRGILLSPLGATLAQFHEPKWRGEVFDRLEKWVGSLPAEQVEVIKLKRKQ